MLLGLGSIPVGGPARGLLNPGCNQRAAGEQRTRDEQSCPNQWIDRLSHSRIAAAMIVTFRPWWAGSGASHSQEQPGRHVL